MQDDDKATPIQDDLLPSSVQVKINKTKKTVNYYYVDSKGKKILINLSEKTEVAPSLKALKETPKQKK